VGIIQVAEINNVGRTSNGRRWPAAAGLLASMVALAGCQLLNRQANTNSDANRPSLKAARNALQEGEAATALSIARGVLISEPKNVAALVAAGDADVAMSNPLEAEKFYRQAEAAQPGYVPARLGTGKLKLRQDVKGAEAEFRAVLAVAPKDTAALTDLGVALDLQERHKEAQAQYKAAIAINPDLTAARVNLALSLALSGEATEAEQMLRDEAQAGPVSPRVRADFALAQVMAGHSQDAEVTLQADLSADEAKASVSGMSSLLPQAVAKP
jgi:Flp pilus assembly protein TadD